MPEDLAPFTPTYGHEEFPSSYVTKICEELAARRRLDEKRTTVNPDKKEPDNKSDPAAP